MSVAFSRVVVGAALLLGSGAVLADGPTDIFEKVNACTEAAIKQQPGMVVAWAIESAKEPVTLSVSVLGQDDRVWTMKCSEGQITSKPERKLGNKNYKMLESRAKVPEVSGRFTAASAYPISEFRKMEYGLS